MQKLDAAENELARLRGDLQAARKDEAMRQQEWMATAQIGRLPDAQKRGFHGRQ